MSDDKNRLPTKIYNSATSLPVHRALSGHYFANAKSFAMRAKEIEDDFNAGRHPEKEGRIDSEYLGYSLHSIVASIMGLEAYINEQMYLCNPEGLPRCPHKHSDSALERKICAIYQDHSPDSPPFRLNSHAQYVVFVRNQYVHYDFEGVSGDTIADPITESEKRLEDVLVYFEPLFKAGTLKKSPIYADSPLFPLGFLSSSFAKWCLRQILTQVKEISEHSNAPLPMITERLIEAMASHENK